MSPNNLKPVYYLFKLFLKQNVKSVDIFKKIEY